MPKLLSDKKITFKVGGGFNSGGEEVVEIPTGSVVEKKDTFNFVYYKVTTRDNIYNISEPEYEEKIKAINAGAKFVKLGNDVVNINEIKVFSKKIASKNKGEI